MAGETQARPDGLGIWIRFWDLLIAFALLIGAFLLVRLEAVPQLKGLAAEKAYFASKPLLLDTYRRGYSFETVRDHLRALGAEGRDYYAHSFVPIYDLALSLFILTFLVLFILYATQSDKHHALSISASTRKLLLVPPVLQFMFDVGENVLLRRIIDSFPWIDVDVVGLASLCSQLKWIAIFVNALIILGLGGYTLFQWMNRPAEKA